MSRAAHKRFSLSLMAAVVASVCWLALQPALAQNASSIPRPAPVAYEALYEARAMGMRSTAYRRLEQSENGEYILEHGLSASVLGATLISVEESSRFRWDDNGAVPLEYHYQQGGVRHRDERVQFDQEQRSAQLSRENREQTLTLEGQVLDDLSFSAQLSADLLADPALHAVDTVLRYQIVDARRLDTHEYRVLGLEKITTGAGELEALKLERVRDANSDRSTILWLAPANQFTLARLQQVENGSNMELTLKEITWRD